MEKEWLDWIDSTPLTDKDCAVLRAVPMYEAYQGIASVSLPEPIPMPQPRMWAMLENE